MIAWQSYLSGLAAVLARTGPQGPLSAEAVEAAAARAPRMRNTPYPVTPMPLLLEAAAADRHAAVMARYLALVEKLIRLYREDAAVRAHIGLLPEEDRLARLDDGLGHAVSVCRIDGYLRAEDAGLRILENNADSPAGTLFTPRLDALVGEISGPVLAGAGIAVRPAPLDGPSAVLDHFLAEYRRWGGRAERPRLAILQESGKSNVESLEMAARFTAAGTPSVVRDPAELAFGEDGVRDADGAVDLCWNKINTVYWRRYITGRETLLDAFAAAIGQRRLLHLNAFSARYVAESKRALALLHEEAFADRFDAEEAALARAVLPWAAKLEPGKSVTFDGARHDLAALAIERQARFVLKEPYDIRGDGVTVGRAVGAEEWRSRVERGVAEGHVLQEYVAPLMVPIAAGEPACLPMKISLDTFMFAGAFAGFGSKASLNDRVNLFQGGRKLSVRIAAEPGR